GGGGWIAPAASADSRSSLAAARPAPTDRLRARSGNLLDPEGVRRSTARPGWTPRGCDPLFRAAVLHLHPRPRPQADVEGTSCPGLPGRLARPSLVARSPLAKAPRSLAGAAAAWGGGPRRGQPRFHAAHAPRPHTLDRG